MEQASSQAGPGLALGAAAVWGLHRAFAATYRYTVSGRPEAELRRDGGSGRCIYALWHRDLWQLIPRMRDQGICVMVSKHRDGERVAQVLERWGFTLVRGSSTREGARALLEFLRVAEKGGRDLAITVDGPRGPAQQVKEGIVFAASRSGLPIRPLGAWAERAWQARSWDRMVVAKPGSRVGLRIAEPLAIGPEASRDELRDEHLGRLARAIDGACEEARRLLAPC